MKKIGICSILMALILIIFNISFAKGEMQIICDKSIIEQNEEVNVSINIKNIKVAALTVELYWDNSKLEYLSGPENSNKLNNRILYTWVSQNAENIDELNIETFKFKALEKGITSIAITGELYNSAGDKIEIDTDNLEIKVGKKTDEKEVENKQNENVSSDNTDLGILRLNHEGITPEFNKDIKEYYFITKNNIKNLEITAIPENSRSNLTITGNDNLKMGENTIEIKIESEDKTRTSTYKIYVTKTTNLETANTNLETLAVRQATLNPQFDSNITQYKVEISNDINKIDILAIPQRENAKVNIVGNEEMQVGNNKIEINVLAENGTTHKKYEIIVHRRDKEEEISNQEEREIQAMKLSAILKENQNKDENTIKEKNNGKSAIIISFVGLCVIAIVIIIYKHKIK